ncbi:MAG: VWA domain-containing protein, partial [Wohlfahrtiimonas sp.]
EVASKEYTVTVDTTVDAGKPEIVTDLDGDSTITTTVDPKDVTKVEVIDPKTGKEIPGLTVKGPDADGKVVIEGKIPAGVDPELKVTDKVGNEVTTPITDKTPAATVFVDGYEDNVDGQGKVTTPSNIESGDFTNDNTPVISGTATNAKTVDVYIDGKLVGTATVGTDGKWSLPELTTPLSEGPHTITAKATNGAGKEVGSNEYTVTVDTKIDAGKPHIEMDKEGNVTITTTVDPDDHVTKVEIVDKDGNPVLDVDTKEPLVGTPDAEGNVKIEGKLPPEVTTPELKVTDKAGNTTKVPTPFILEDEAFIGKIVAGSDTTATYTVGTQPINGTVTIDSKTGEYTYTPNKDFSGGDTFTVSVSDDNGEVKEIMVPIFVTAVADAPSITESMEFDVGELALNKYVWNNINGKITIGGKEYEFDGSKTGGNGSGNGINPTTLVEGINALLANKDKDGERKPAVEDQTTILKDPDVKAGSAVLINGLVYLEEGKTYTYKGQADDSGMIIIGNGLSSQYVSWAGPTGGQHSSVFTVEKTGFYDFNLYVHNETGKGNFDFKVTEENGADVKYYPSAEAIQKELPGFIQLGDKDTANGFYDMKFGYAGYETDKIKLEKIHAKLADVDGSETLTVTLSNLPAGTKLTVTSVDNQGNEVLVEVTADSNGQIILTGKDNVVEFKDFELELPKDAKVGTETINVEVTATEKSNGDSKSDSFDFEVTVKDPADLITTMKVETAGNGDDDIAGIDGSHNVLVGDQGGVQTNFVAGHDYNVAVVLDVSGSMYYSMGDTNRMAVAKEGLKLFVSQMANHQGEINFTLITFDFDAKAYGTFKVTQDNLQEVWDKIDSIPKENKGTSPEAGFDLANTWFNQQTNNFENQTYFITDGDPSGKEQYHWDNRDAKFKPLAEQSKVFAVGLGEVHVDNVKRYDNTDEFGNKIENWSKDNTGSAQVLQDKEALISYLIGGSENFKPAEAGNDKVTGGNGHDILFGDAINTNHLQWDGRDSIKHPQYSGYSTLIDYLKATV